MSDHEFDVEEYRGDMERRRDSLRSMEQQYHHKWLHGKREGDFADAQRCAHKADGLDIALSLLPGRQP